MRPKQNNVLNSLYTWIRDAIAFNPERFDITRSNSQHHAHVGFGHGIHFLLGSSLSPFGRAGGVESNSSKITRFKF